MYSENNKKVKETFVYNTMLLLATALPRVQGRESPKDFQHKGDQCEYEIPASLGDALNCGQKWFDLCSGVRYPKQGGKRPEKRAEVVLFRRPGELNTSP